MFYELRVASYELRVLPSNLVTDFCFINIHYWHIIQPSSWINRLQKLSARRTHFKILMKILFPLLLVLLCNACNEKDQDTNNATSIKTASESGEKTAYSPEELLGKTVEEYEEFVQQKEAGTTPENTADKTKDKDEPIIKNGFLQLSWNDLIAPGYDATAIIKKYEPQVKALEEGSIEALKLYEKMEAEFNTAPPNETLANKKVSIPGFIAPLEQVDGLITEFLLVPYFGACIHNPPPPTNQTVHVKVARSFEIKSEDSYEPIWVSGELLIEESNTDIGNASYKIQDAVISEYKYE